MTPNNIKQRYFRGTISSPEGVIVHDGDCSYWSMNLCTCGLLNELIFYSNIAAEMYPKFWEEWQRHQNVMGSLRGLAATGGTMINNVTPVNHPVQIGPKGMVGPANSGQCPDDMSEIVKVIENVINSKEKNES